MIELLLEAERALEMGRIDAAETLYQRVAEADPRNAIAVVGMARVTLERGDERGAYLVARRALTIDRENSAAQRMVTRLEEVLRYRGESLPEPGSVSEPEALPEPESVPEPGPPSAPKAGSAQTTPPAPRPDAPRGSLLERVLRRGK